MSTVRARDGADFIIVGGGIVGVNVAMVLKSRYPSASVLVLEKEETPGLHASGRNSGVLHAGFYYSPDSLKARLTRQGNLFLRSYCESRGIPLRQCGKLVVARNASEVAGLEALFERGKTNGVPLEMVSAQRAQRIEPLVRTHDVALWSPSTAVSDPAAVLAAQVADAGAAGVSIEYNARVAQIEKLSSGMIRVRTEDGRLRSTGHLVNCAGLYADRIAHQLDFGAGLALLPFKGLYLYCDIPLRTLVYPVPLLGAVFLGTHFTVTVDGKTKIGPTAIPALWRQQYGESSMLQNFAVDEATEIMCLEARMLALRPELRALAAMEAKKYVKRWMAAGASELVAGASADKFTTYGRAGIRAQLVHKDTGRLEMDLVVQGDASSTHVLNAVSPAWTCARPFAEFVADAVAGNHANLPNGAVGRPNPTLVRK